MPSFTRLRCALRQPYTQLYLHLVWSTWDRMPLITPALQQPIYGCICEQVKKHRCEPLAVGGIADHVHLLVRFQPMARISEVVQHAKGASSHLVTQVLDPGGFFKWQGYYGAFSLSKRRSRTSATTSFARRNITLAEP